MRRAPARRRPARLPDAVRVVVETRARGEMGRWCGVAGRDDRDEADGAALDCEGAGLVREPALEPGLPVQDHLVTVERGECAQEARGAVQDAEPCDRLDRRERRGQACGRVERPGEDPVAGRRRGRHGARRYAATSVRGGMVTVCADDAPDRPARRRRARRHDRASGRRASRCAPQHRRHDAAAPGALRAVRVVRGNAHAGPGTSTHTHVSSSRSALR